MTDTDDAGATGGEASAPPTAKPSLAENMRKALAMKRAASAETHPDGSPGDGAQTGGARGASLAGPGGSRPRKRDGG